MPITWTSLFFFIKFEFSTLKVYIFPYLRCKKRSKEKIKTIYIFGEVYNAVSFYFCGILPTFKTV